MDQARTMDRSATERIREVTDAERSAGITYEELGIIVRNEWGDEKTHCPRCHSERRHRDDRSLSVKHETGQWLCHHPGCDWKGSLLATARKRGRKMTEQSYPKTPLTRVSYAEPAPLPPTLDSWAIEWFGKRGISLSTLNDFGIKSYEKDIPTGRSSTICFPYFVRDRHVNTKRRMIALDGNYIAPETGKPHKSFTQDRGAEKTVFGMNIVPLDARAVVIVEGEIDALSVYESGWTNVISLPDGAALSATDAKLNALDHPDVKHLLDNVEIIVIATDADEPGRKCAAALVEKLDEVKCWMVEWPDGINDANALLARDGAEALDAVLESAHPVDLEGIHYFDTDFEKVLKLHEHGYEPGASTGWENLDQFFTLTRGTVTVGTGLPGHGKTSLFVAMLMNAVHHHGWKGVMFNPEMGSPATILAKLSQLVANAPVLPTADQQMSRETLIKAMQYVQERVWLIDASQRDEEAYATIGLPELLARAEKAHLRHGIDFLYLDPWNRLEATRPRAMTETEYVAYALNAIGRFARRHNVCVIIVAHPTKQETGRDGEREAMPTPYSIAGSAHWYAMADFIIGVHREKYDEETKGITTVRTWKVREEGDHGNLGQCTFRFDLKGRRFYPTDIQVPEQRRRTCRCDANLGG
jgi:twinkle protein